MDKLPQMIQGKIIKKDDKHIVFELEDGQMLHWPRIPLYEDLPLETPISLMVMVGSDIEQERLRLSKYLLNEILREN